MDATTLIRKTVSRRLLDPGLPCVPIQPYAQEPTPGLDRLINLSIGMRADLDVLVKASRGETAEDDYA